MARHDCVRYVTIGKLKKLLADPRLNDKMLVTQGYVDGLILFRPGKTKKTECCCQECVIGDIWFGDEKVVFR